MNFMPASEKLDRCSVGGAKLRVKPADLGVFEGDIFIQADAVRVPAAYDRIVVSGTPGLDQNGHIPADFADEARQAWRNVAAILEKAGASISDIVSIRQYLTREEDIKTYIAVQGEMITHEPAAMLLVPRAMAWPGIHV